MLMRNQEMKKLSYAKNYIIWCRKNRKRIFAFLNEVGATVVAFCDRNYERIYEIEGTPVIAPEEAFSCSAEIIISMAEKEEVVNVLERRSVKYYYDLMDWMERGLSEEEALVCRFKYRNFRNNRKIEDNNFNLPQKVVQEILSQAHGVKRLYGGVCPVCNKKTIFVAEGYWLRDEYRCIHCESIPRFRALNLILKKLRPELKSLKVHESSLGGCQFLLKEQCGEYTCSYYYETKKPGESIEGVDCEYTNQNLEGLSFADESFDVFITQDVFEHINCPDKAFFEIARVLKPGGIHIFTIPLYPFITSRARIIMNGDKIVPILPPQYHGNPISDKGSLVTYDWGHDIVEYIEQTSGMTTTIFDFPYTEENMKAGLEADFLYVLVSQKKG